MTCEQAAALAELLESGALLDEDQRGALERHLARCEHCKNQYGWQLQLSALMRGEMEEVPSGFAASVMARIAEEPAPGAAPAPGQTGRRPRMRWAAALAAAIVLVAVLPTAIKTIQGTTKSRNLSGGADQNPLAGDDAGSQKYGLMIEGPVYEESEAVEQAEPQMAAGAAENRQDLPADTTTYEEENRRQEGADDRTPKEVLTSGAEAPTGAEPPTGAATTPPEAARNTDADAVPELWPEAGAQPSAGVAASSAAGEILMKGVREVEDGAPQADWTAILPTELLKQPEDVAEVLIRETPPEQYEEHVATEEADYYILSAEEGYLLIVVPRPA